MEISPITSFDSTLTGMDKLINKGKQINHAGNAQDGYFEEVLNTMMTRELLKPLFESALFAGSAQIQYLIEDALTEHFNGVFNFFELNKGEVLHDK